MNENDPHEGGRLGGLAATLSARAHDNTSPGRDVTHDPEALPRLASYRSAAQSIRRLDASLRERGARMIALMQRARAESDSWTRDLAEQVVWAQAAWMLHANEALRQNRMRGRLEMAARRLRLKGYERCPACEQRLSDPSDWTFWGALRDAEKDRLMALDDDGGEAA